MDSLDDLYDSAMLAEAAKNSKRPRIADPSDKHALGDASKRLRELYTNPDNWRRTRGLALIDRGTNSLIGNFSEYVHIKQHSTRKLVRETSPISVEAVEYVEGYLGEAPRREHFDPIVKHHCDIDVWFEQMMVGAPKVALIACCHMGAMVRLELYADTQFASISGATLLQVPAGVDILAQVSPDSRRAAWKAIQP